MDLKTEILCTAGILLILLTLLLTGCGDDTQLRYNPPCNDQLAICEYLASRTSGDSIVHVLKLWDCAEEQGHCAKVEGLECERSCDITRQKEYCMRECE